MLQGEGGGRMIVGEGRGVARWERESHMNPCVRAEVAGCMEKVHAHALLERVWTM